MSHFVFKAKNTEPLIKMTLWNKTDICKFKKTEQTAKC